MSDVFCSAPWNSLYIETTGVVKPCCASKVPYGNIHEQPIDEIINGPIHLEVKRSLLEGRPHRHCQSCYQAEKSYGDSTRYWFNQHLPVDTPEIEDFKLQMIDIRWSNNCNLKCLYCSETFSSSIAEFRKIDQKLSIRQWQDQVMQMIKNNIVHIKEVYLLGGEPLLIKENSELLDYLTDQRISVFTNLSLDNSKNPIYKKLLTKPNVSWEISLEQTGKKFEYVRNGASWDQVLKNYNDLKSQGKNVSFTMQYCIYSALDLHAVLTELKCHGTVVINLLLYPGYLALNGHCETIKKIAVSEIDRVISDANLIDWLGSDNLEKLLHIKTSIYDIKMPDQSKRFVDNEKNIPGPVSFSELWPEAWRAIVAAQ